MLHMVARKGMKQARESAGIEGAVLVIYYTLSRLIATKHTRESGVWGWGGVGVGPVTYTELVNRYYISTLCQRRAHTGSPKAAC